MYIVRVFSSSTRYFIGLLVKFIQGALCVIRQYMHGYIGGAKLYSIVYRVLSLSGRETHLRPMRFPKRAPHAMCSTAQDAHIAGFSVKCRVDYSGKDQNDLVKIFFYDTQVI